MAIPIGTKMIYPHLNDRTRKWVHDMRLRRPRHGIAGFTLVECLVAIVILAIGLTGAAECLSTALLANQKASRIQLATATAQDTIEDMRSRGFGRITEEEFPASESVPSLPSGQRTIEIIDSYNGNDRLKHISVTVSWRSRHGIVSRVHMGTIVSNRTGHVGAK
jgi:prepilin-type N-terminal cleavage/methylation domain-containing protein